MNRRYWLGLPVVVATLALVGCNGGGSAPEAPPAATGPRLVTQISVPNIAAGKTFSFDIGMICNGLYYLTDKINKSVDVVDPNDLTKLKAQISGTGATAFFGIPKAGDNTHSGPTGITCVNSLIYVGDVNSVKIIDPSTNTITKNIVVSNTADTVTGITGTAGRRADESCFDPDDNLYAISSPEETPPFMTFINTTTQAVVARLTFVDPQGNPGAGLEQCVYDHASRAFIVNNDGTTVNPHGELNIIPAAAVVALIATGTSTGQGCNGPFTGAFLPTGGAITASTGNSAAGITTVCGNYTSLAPPVIASSQGTCEPKGMDLGPGTDLIVMCSQTTGFYTTGTPLTSLIMNRSTGAAVQVIPFGGGDELWFDPPSNRYILPTGNWTATGGKAAPGTASLTPRLQIVDATSRTLVASLPMGQGAHSVAVDPTTGLAFVPYSFPVAVTTPPAAAPTCADCAANGFTSGGISVFAIK